MSVTAEEIRQAKKFLENKNYSIKKVKPRQFAIVSKELKIKFSDLLNKFEKEIENGKTTTSD